MIKKVYKSLRGEGLALTWDKVVRRFGLSIKKGTGAVERGQKFEIIYLNGCQQGESKRYRVYNLSEYIETLGFRTLVLSYESFPMIIQKKIKANAIVIFRAPFKEKIGLEKLFSYCKSNNINIIYDIDDAVFLPEIVPEIHSVKAMSQDSKNRYLEDVWGYRKLLLMADRVIVPTRYLQKIVEKMGKSCEVIPNTLNDYQISFSKNAVPRVRVGEVVIGYFSGSNTHDRDFEECSDALFHVMTLNDNVRLKIVGYLTMPNHWDIFNERIIKKDFCGVEEMMFELEKCDINIAPLEMRSTFCNAKSELKYFEAAILKKPTIASATSTFEHCINNWVNGVLARDKKDWMDGLQKLIDNPKTREEIGLNARAHAFEKYYIRNLRKEIINGYGINDFPRIKKSNYEIMILVPGIKLASGGHRNIFRIAHNIAKLGHKITLIFTDTNLRSEVIKKIIHQNYYPINCEIRLISESNESRVDIIIATHWATVKYALRYPLIVSKLYFVQDYEPYFYPMGSDYILAENTYKAGLYCICSGKWVWDFITTKYAAQSDYFDFPIDRSIYYQRVVVKKTRRILFFAKPEMPRRCYEIGVEALRIVKRFRPHIEIIFFGSDAINEKKIGFPVVCKGILPDLNSLAQLYSECHVGIVFSSTNPSLVAYEMMACGLPVVDLDTANVRINYGARDDIAKICSPNPQLMARQIIDLIEDEDELFERTCSGIDYVSRFPTEARVADYVESLIRKYHENNVDQNKNHGFEYK